MRWEGDLEAPVLIDPVKLQKVEARPAAVSKASPKGPLPTACTAAAKQAEVG